MAHITNNQSRFITISESGKHHLKLTEPGKYVVFVKNVSGEILVDLCVEGVEVQIYGIYIGENAEKYTLSTMQRHQAPNSTSNLLIRSAMDGSSSFRYQGLISIEKGAQKSHAYQKNQNLLLSPNAFIESKPNLEILANEVFCTHGSTTGRLNADQVYYLQSRGMTEPQARSIIVEGFFGEIYEAIEQFKNS